MSQFEYVDVIVSIYHTITSKGRSNFVCATKWYAIDGRWYRTAKVVPITQIYDKRIITFGDLNRPLPSYHWYGKIQYRNSKTSSVDEWKTQSEVSLGSRSHILRCSLTTIFSVLHLYGLTESPHWLKWVGTSSTCRGKSSVVTENTNISSANAKCAIVIHRIK